MILFEQQPGQAGGYVEIGLPPQEKIGNSFGRQRARAIIDNSI